MQFSAWTLHTLTLVVVGCSRAPSVGGARIAEDPGGRWLFVCSLSVNGPDREPVEGKGTATAPKIDDAKHNAAKKACDDLKAGPACERPSDGWSHDVPSAACKKVTKTPTVDEWTCDATVRRPSAKRNASKQAEARYPGAACKNALSAACKELDAGEPCLTMADGWTKTVATARMRPSDSP